MKKLLAILLLALCGPTMAATYYIRDCGAGSEGTCTAGSDAADGLSDANAWQNCSKIKTHFNTAPAGTVYRFAKGAAWATCDLAFTGAPNTSGRSNPIIFDSYSPATGGTVVPKLTNAAGTLFGFVDSGNSDHDEGYIVRNLHLIGNNVGTGINVGGDADYVTIDNVEIEKFTIGVRCNGGTTNAQNPGSDGLSEHFIVKNSNIHDNYQQGLELSCSDMLIENNTISKNGANIGDHNIYVDDSAVGSPQVATTLTQIVIRGNTLTENTPYSGTTYTAGTCKSVSLVMHGLKSGILIENNVFKETTVPTSANCWGLGIDAGQYSAPYNVEGFSQVVVRGNTFVNYAISVSLDICQNCLVENNYVYTETTSNTYGIKHRGKQFEIPLGGDDLVSSNVTIRNNSLYFKFPDANTIGIWSARHASDLFTATTGLRIDSNLIHFESGSTSATMCFNTQNFLTAQFTSFNYNLCNFAGTQGVWVKDGTTASPTTKTLAAWTSATGFDVNSVISNSAASTIFAVTPGSGNNWSLATITTSPTKNTGHPTQSARLAIFGLLRSTADATPDMGAFEFKP